MKEIKTLEQSVMHHYRRTDLSARILAALEKAGKTIHSYQDTAAFDEFHIRGREATRELARLAGLRAGLGVLDMGCGLGGPARLLAAEFGCTVTGIDLMEEFVQAAAMLTQMVGLANRVSFCRGSMLALPFDKASFDAAWFQHTMVNIADKSRLLDQVRRVLKPGGILALNEIVAGAVAPLHYPVQWAGDPSIDFLLEAQDLLQANEAAGFEAVAWQDTTTACRAWFEAVVARMAQRSKDAPPPLALNLVIGPTTAQKAANTVRNLQEDRIRVICGVFRKKSA
jgi:SAM-dependent methyltransferase